MEFNVYIDGFIPTDIVVDQDGNIWKSKDRTRSLSFYDLTRLLIKARYAYLQGLIPRQTIPIITHMLINLHDYYASEDTELVSRLGELVIYDTIDAITLGHVAKVVFQQNLETAWIRIYGVDADVLIGFFESSIPGVDESIFRTFVALNMECICNSQSLQYPAHY